MPGRTDLYEYANEITKILVRAHDSEWIMKHVVALALGNAENLIANRANAERIAQRDRLPAWMREYIYQEEN